jgi:hypothetical protein
MPNPRQRELPDRVQRFVKVVTWLDEARWRAAPDLFGNPVYDLLDPSQKVLVHWLCYITNRQRPFRDVWDNGGFVFSTLVADYAQFMSRPGSVQQFLEEHQRAGKGKLPAYYASSSGREVSYTPRFGADHESIERTLDLLSDYGGSLTTFISDFIVRFRAEPEGLRRLAHSLDLLSYRLELRLDEASSLLHSDADLAWDFRTWQRSSAEHHKRLWASLRDYRKPGSPFHGYLEAQIRWPHSGFELDQLELPGDTWNARFSRTLLAQLASDLGLNASAAKASKTGRRLYDRILRLDPHTDFYPERLDFSFDFTPRMCDQGMCDVCLFAHPASLPCFPDVRQETSPLCPVLLFTCGYRHPCIAPGCPVAGGVSYGLCAGR